MFCNFCGTSNRDDARFCSSCGKPLATTGAVETIPPGGSSSLTDTPAESSAERYQTIGSNPTAVGAAPDASEILKAGERFAERYEIVRLIGRGGMGAVYEARDQVISEPVALKVLLNGLADHPEAVNRFTREAKISRQLGHKHIVRVHDIGSFQGRLFISMEYVDGVNLRRFFENRKKQNKPLSVKEVLLLARPLCEAMEYAHEITVHRDLKPENILVTRDGKVKVSDFGIATLLNLSESRLTSGALGTAYYMAPEQMDGATKIDRRADIYSLGVILYEALTGKVPVGRFKNPAALRDDIPPHIDEAVMKALDPEPQERPKSMKELLGWLSGERKATAPRGNDSDVDDDGESHYRLSSSDSETSEEPSTKPIRKGDPKAAQQALEQGKKEFQSGNAEKALQLLNRAVRDNPKSAEAWFFRAQALSHAKLGTDPDEKWRRVASGKMTLDEVQKTANEVVANLRKAADLEPDNALYKLTATLAEKQIQQGQGVLPGTESKTKAQPAAKKGGLLGKFLGGSSGSSGDVEALVNRANQHLNSGDLKAAIASFDMAIKCDKKCAAAWYGKGLALGKTLGNGQADVLAKIANGEMDINEVQRIGNEAKHCLRQAAKLEPSNPLYQMVASQIKD